MASVPKAPKVDAESIQRVLALVAEIAADLETYSVDQIDGEFYWRCCRTDAFPLVERLRVCAGLPDNERFRRSNELLREAMKRYPLPIVSEWAAGRRLWMRARPDATAYWEPDDVAGQEVPFVTVFVYSKQCTGDDVERAIEELAALHGLRRTAPHDGEVRGTDAKFAFLTDERDKPTITFIGTVKVVGKVAPTRWPAVAVYTPLPLCRAGGIGREYEEVVRNQLRWHLRLPDAEATRQDKEVALRTWGVGLLLQLGQRFISAMPRVCEAGQLAEASQARFGVDRKALVGRVREAAPFLTQRPRPGEGLQTA